MKTKLLYLGIIITICLACDDNIGNLDFEQSQKKEYTLVLPEIGAFNFKQEFSTSSSPNSIKTSLQINMTNPNHTVLRYEVFNFKNAKRTFDNLDFVVRDTVVTDFINYKVIKNAGNILVGDDNTYISVVSIDSTSSVLGAHYEGTGQIRTITQTDTIVDPVFNLYGNINIYNQLFLMPREEIPQFDNITGTYLLTGEFTGVSTKYDTSGSLRNMDNMPLTITNTKLTDTLSLTISNQSMQLILNLTKTN